METQIQELPGLRMIRFGPLGKRREDNENKDLVSRFGPFGKGGGDSEKEDSRITRNPGDSIWALGRGRDEMEDSGVTRNLGDSIWVLGKRER